MPISVSKRVMLFSYTPEISGETHTHVEADVLATSGWVQGKAHT